MATSEASRRRPSDRLDSSPLFTASKCIFDGERSVSGDLRKDGFRAGDQFRSRDHFVHQTDAISFLLRRSFRRLG